MSYFQDHESMPVNLLYLYSRHIVAAVVCTSLYRHVRRSEMSHSPDVGAGVPTLSSPLSRMKSFGPISVCCSTSTMRCLNLEAAHGRSIPAEQTPPLESVAAGERSAMRRFDRTFAAKTKSGPLVARESSSHRPLPRVTYPAIPATLGVSYVSPSVARQRRSFRPDALDHLLCVPSHAHGRRRPCSLRAGG